MTNKEDGLFVFNNVFIKKHKNKGENPTLNSVTSLQEFPPFIPKFVMKFN